MTAMRGTSIIALAALLMMTDARPDGYGVKSGRSYKSAANAAANAHAHANAGSLATASSSASAIATADSKGYGTSNAIASADASADSRNTEKDVRNKENENANGLVDSDDLRQSNDRGGETEYKCINHKTASWDQRNSGGEDVIPEFDREDTDKTEQVQDYDDCGSDAVNGGASKDGTGSRCKDKTIGVDGGSAGQGQNTQTIDASHSSGPCALGDSRCSTHKLVTPSPYPVHGSTSNLPTGSSGKAEIKGGYGGIDERPGMIDRSHAASPCAPENPKCYVHKPGVPNSYPTFHKHSDSSAGSSGSARSEEEDHVISHGKPEKIDENFPGKTCASGDSKCQTHHPANSHTQFGGKPDLSGGSPSPADIDAGQGEYSPQPGKPDEAHPTYEGTKDLQHPTVSDSAYEGNNKRPGTPDASSCAPDDAKCFAHKPSVSNPSPTYVENPDLSAGSSSPKAIDGGYGGKPDIPETTGQSDHSSTTPCAPWDSKCSSHKPTVSNLPASYDKIPSYDSQHSEVTGGAYGGHTSTAGTFGGSHSESPCAIGDSKCFAHKTIVSNAYPTYVEKPDLSAGSSSPKAIDGGYGGKPDRPGTTDQSDHRGTTPCAPWDSKCSSHKPTVSNLPASYDKNPSYDSQHSEVTGGASGGHTSTAGTFGGSHSESPCATGDSKCFAHKPSVPTNYPVYETEPVTWTPTGGDHSHPDKVPSQYPSSGSKPKTSNPFLNGQIDLSSINKPSSPGELPGHKVNPSNPFLYPHNQAHPSTSQNLPVSTAPQHPQGSSAGGSGFVQDKPKPPNPFLSQPGYANPMFGVKLPATDGTYRHEEKEYTVINRPPNTNCHGSVSCAPNRPSTHFTVPPKYPQGSSSQSPEYPKTKPNPSNPFLLHHASRDESAGSTDLEVGNQNNRYPHIVSQPTSITPGKDCHKSVSSSTNKPADVPSENPFLMQRRPKIEPHLISGHGSTQFPGTQPDNGPLASNAAAGHQNAESDGREPGTVQGCAISSPMCNKVPNKMDHQSSIGAGFESSSTTGQKDHGVKRYRPGVKGGPRQPEHPLRLQGSSTLDKGVHVPSEQNPTAESIANASAHSSAHASSSSSAAAAHASAKSEAHSSHDGHGSSSSWSSSNASASAFSSSHSSSGSYHDWTGTGFPEIPAQ